MNTKLPLAAIIILFLAQCASAPPGWKQNFYNSRRATRICDYDNALKYVRKALITAQKQSPDKEYVSESFKQEARIYIAKKEYLKAETSIKKALAHITKTHGRRHARYAWAQLMLGEILIKTKRFEKAIEVLQDSRAIQQERLGKNHYALSGTSHSLGRAYSLLGRKTEADRFFKESVRIHTARFGKDSLLVALYLDDYAEHLVKTKRPEKALISLKESLRIKLKRLKEIAPTVAETLQELVAVNRSLGDEQQALMFDKRLKASRKSYKELMKNRKVKCK